MNTNTITLRGTKIDNIFNIAKTYKNLFKVLAVALLNPSGFTCNTQGEKVKSGYISGIADSQGCNIWDLPKVYAMAKEKGLCVGGWYDKEGGRYYLDCSKSFNNESEAINFAKENEQIAIYHINENKVIRIK